MKKLKLRNPFVIFILTQLAFAFLIFLNELYSKPYGGPFGNYPIEHKSSWAKTLLFCFGAILGYFVFWFFNSKKKWSALFPSFWLALLFALLLTSFSTIPSHYLAFIGWCCESQLAFYFGFPFSFLLGIGSYHYSVMQPYENYGLLKIFFTSEPYVRWNFLPYEFFLDSLFWLNVIFIFISLFNLFRQKVVLHKLAKMEVQSKSN